MEHQTEESGTVPPDQVPAAYAAEPLFGPTSDVAGEGTGRRRRMMSWSRTWPMARLWRRMMTGRRVRLSGLPPASPGSMRRWPGLMISKGCR